MSICLPGLTPAHAADGAPGATGNTVTQTTGSATTRDSAISVTGGTGGTGGEGTPTLTFNSSATNTANVVTPSTGGMGGRGGTGNAAAVSGAASGASSATVFATGGAGGMGGTGGAGIAVSGTGTVLTNQGVIFGGIGGVGGDGGGAAGAATSIVTDPAGNATAAVTARNGAGGTGGTGGAGIALTSNGIVLNNNAGVVFGGDGGTGGQPGPANMGMPPSSTANTSFTPSASASSGSGAAASTSASTPNAGPVTAAGAAGIGTRGNTAGAGAGASNGVIGGAAQGLGVATGGSGGDGGTGGAGVFASGRNVQVVNTAGVILGGDGGAGQAGDPGASSVTINGKTAGGLPNNGGNGGTGGAGLLFTRPGAALTNTGVIIGGNGGVGGAAGGLGVAGNGGAGGAGVVANGIQINNTGIIFGGFANGGAGAQAFAIAFTGGDNFVGGNGLIVGGIDVQGGASFQPALPGSPLGVPLQITGPLQFARTATYQIRLNTTTSDIAVATGNATLNGARVFAQSPDGVAAPPRFMRYTILTATGGIVGTFNPIVASNLAFFKPTLAYDATNVYLDAAYNYVITGGTQNQIAVGSGLNNVAYGPLSPVGNQIFNALNKVQQGQAGAVLDSLSGEGITASQNIAFRSAQLFNSAIFDQTTFYSSGGTANSITLGAPQPGFTALATPEQTLAAANSGQKVRELADLPNRKVEPAMPAALQRTWRAWGSGFGGVENIQGNGQIGSANQNNSIIGGAIGVDYQLLPNYLLGVAVGGTDGSFRVPGRATSGSTSGGHVAFYDIATFGKFYGASSTSFSYFGNRTTRVTGGFGGLATETQRGDFNSHEFRSRLEFGRHLDGPGLGGPGGALGALGALGVLTPFVALELAQLRSNGFNERAIAGPGLLGLNVQGQSIASVPSFVGFRLQRVTPLGNGMIFSPTLQVAWVHEFAPFRNQTAQIANLPGSVFLVDGARPARDAAQVKAGGELIIGPRTAVFANFDGEFSGINQLYAGKGGLRYIW